MTDTNKKVFEQALTNIQDVLKDNSAKFLKTEQKNIENLFKIDSDFDKKLTSRSGSGEIRFVSTEILDASSVSVETFEALSTVTFVFSMISYAKIPAGASFGFLIRDEMGYDLFACNSNYYDYYLNELEENSNVVICVKLLFPLMAGKYSLHCGLKPYFNSNYFYDRPFNVKVFEVFNPVFLADKNFGGKLYVKPLEFKLLQKNL